MGGARELGAVQPLTSLGPRSLLVRPSV
jgi:hypothetical protein